MKKKATNLLAKIIPSVKNLNEVCKSRFKTQLPDMVGTKLDEVNSLLKSMETNFKSVIDSEDPKIIDYEAAQVTAAVKDARQVCATSLELYKLCKK